jgi:general secretion pathway protein K
MKTLHSDKIPAARSEFGFREAIEEVVDSRKRTQRSQRDALFSGSLRSLRSFAASSEIGLRPCRGIALIIVLISVFVLTILAGGFAYSMKIETRLARNANSETELEWLGRSAVECARWELGQYRTVPLPYDALDQPWAGGANLMGISNTPLAEFKHEIHTENGEATWTIVDLERKININSVTEPMLQQALMVAGLDPSEITPVANSILDWLDPDDLVRLQGAEKDYYEGLRPAYLAKNGPIDDISELLLIRGVTAELYYGIASTNYMSRMFNQESARYRSLGSALPSHPVALTSLFTPLSNGRININTASAEVLQILPNMTPEIAQEIVSAREGEDDGSHMFGPYRLVSEIERSPTVPRNMSATLQQYADVRSSTFEVRVDAQISGYHRYFTAVLGRNNPRDVQVLTFSWTDQPR